MSTCFFFFQAEDGIRDGHVTGVQTCALPICIGSSLRSRGRGEGSWSRCGGPVPCRARQIGRASCRERVEMAEAARGFNKRRLYMLGYEVPKRQVMLVSAISASCSLVPSHSAP